MDSVQPLLRFRSGAWRGRAHLTGRKHRCGAGGEGGSATPIARPCGTRLGWFWQTPEEKHALAECLDLYFPARCGGFCRISPMPQRRVLRWASQVFGSSGTLGSMLLDNDAAELAAAMEEAGKAAGVQNIASSRRGPLRASRAGSHGAARSGARRYRAAAGRNTDQGWRGPAVWKPVWRACAGRCGILLSATFAVCTRRK